MTNHTQVNSLLMTLQQEMQRLNQWSHELLSEKAMQSQQPFCMDTMSFSQWLQFIFIPRMQAMIDGKLPLPVMAKGQGIEPMASEYFKHDKDCQSIVAVIAQLDESLTQ